MAAATATRIGRENVIGHLRQLIFSSVVFANTGDTLTVPGVKKVLVNDLTPTTNASFGLTVSGNIITLTAGAGLTFGGSVMGL